MSSKSAKLGMGASFAQTQTVSSRRQAINAATQAPTEGAPPPLKLPVDVISLNPANPRSELGDLTQLAGSLRDHGQKAAISIMSRFAYIEANPGQEALLEPGTKYVAIDGNSRLAAAREAGLTDIKVMLDEDLGSDPDELLESALVANIHRQELDPLDEAKALKQLLTVHGTQEALAARLHRSQGWVSQRLALLGLTPELKQKLAAGEESADLLRRVGNKKPEEQQQHLERLKEKKRQEEADKKTRAKDRQTTPTPAVQQPTGTPDTEATERPSPAADHYAVIKQPSPTDTKTKQSVPDPRPAPAQEAPKRMAWNDGPGVMELVHRNMFPSERPRAIGRYLELLGSPEAFADQLAEAVDPEYRQRLAELLTKDL